MALIHDLVFQGAQMLLVLLLAPLLTGFVRKVKARLLRRRGPPLIQPYRDLARLLRKDVVLAHNASWLFRVIPYLIFAATWVAASLVPTFRSGLLFSWTADLIALIALLGSARFFLALAGMDAGTGFGGIGASREVMIASLAEPAMMMIVFAIALIAGSTQLSTMAAFMNSPEVGLRVSLGLGLIALVIVVASLIAGPSRPDPEKTSAYECGFEAFDDARSKFDVRFYLVSILFIIFDLEVAFLFPWAVSLGKIGMFGFWSMMLFLGVLTVGFIYEWKKGALEWE